MTLPGQGQEAAEPAAVAQEVQACHPRLDLFVKGDRGSELVVGTASRYPRHPCSVLAPPMKTSQEMKYFGGIFTNGNFSFLGYRACAQFLGKACGP